MSHNHTYPLLAPLSKGFASQDLVGVHIANTSPGNSNFHDANSHLLSPQLVYLVVGDYIDRCITQPFLPSSYVGQVVDGLRDGWGCYKCAGSHVTYTGSWKNGKRNGKVKCCQHFYADSFFLTSCKHCPTCQKVSIVKARAHNIRKGVKELAILCRRSDFYLLKNINDGMFYWFSCRCL